MSAESADCSSLVVFLEILDRGLIERVAMRPSQYCVYSQQRRGDNQLLKISKMGRSSCCSNEAIKRGAWTNKEDMILRDYIQLHGDGDGWRNLPQKAGLNRCGSSCRLRWVNYLRPGIKRGSISLDEEELIIRMHRLLGNRWSLIAGRLPGRTDKEIKNYWKTHLSKKLSVKDCRFKRPKSLPSLQNHVFIPTPVKVTAALRPSEMVRPNHECSNMLSSPSDYLSDFGFLHTGPATSFGEERNDFEDGNMN